MHPDPVFGRHTFASFILLQFTLLAVIEITQSISNKTLLSSLELKSNHPFSNVYNSQNPDNIPVNIKLTPYKQLHGKDYVPTGVNLTAKAEILDDKFKNTSITYQWSTKNGTIVTSENATQIDFKFDKPDDDNFLKVLVVHKPNNTGSSQKDLVVRDPISIAEPGKLFFEHGELFKATLKYNGTGPFEYCYQFCLHDKVAMEECDKCSCTNNQYMMRTSLNQLQITRFLRDVGNYTLVYVVDNVADCKRKEYTVKITAIPRKQTIPYVPIVCSISAVFILVSGVALHLKFRRTVYTETADFDFTRLTYLEDEWDEEQSFLERVRYLLFRADRNNQTS